MLNRFSYKKEAQQNKKVSKVVLSVETGITLDGETFVEGSNVNVQDLYVWSGDRVVIDNKNGVNIEGNSPRQLIVIKVE